jgi:hypothetical protein
MMELTLAQRTAVTRANKNDGCHVEQKNWTTVRALVGYHRYDTPAELVLLNKIWTLQSLLTNYFYPQQKLVFKVRDGAKITNKHDTAATPHRRAQAHLNLPTTAKTQLTRTYLDINPAALQRQIHALMNELLTLAITKAGPQRKAPPTRAPTNQGNQSVVAGIWHMRQRRPSRAY